MEDRDYYYVTYIGPGAGGAMVMEQHRPEGGGENPDGFNFVEAIKFLSHHIGATIVVTSWVKTTKKRKEQFETFVQEMTGVPPKKDRPSHLSLVHVPDESPPSL